MENKNWTDDDMLSFGRIICDGKERDVNRFFQQWKSSKVENNPTIGELTYAEKEVNKLYQDICAEGSMTNEAKEWFHLLMNRLTKGIKNLSGKADDELFIGKGRYFTEKPKRDWEIVSYQENNSVKKIWTMENTISDKCRVLFQEPEYWESMMEGLFKIHSVRRLSDGVVFTVGDCVRYKEDMPFNISKLEPHDICPTSMMAWNRDQSGSINITQIEKYYLEESQPSSPKKQERIEVSEVLWFGRHGSKAPNAYRFNTSKPITQEDGNSIKEAIEKIINNEYTLTDVVLASQSAEIRRLAEKLDSAIREAFAAGRMMNETQRFAKDSESFFEYPTVEDYLKTLTQK